MDFSASLSLIVPEILLSVSGLVLLLVAGWAGDKASRAITVIACLVLAACFVLTAPSVCGGAMTTRVASMPATLTISWERTGPEAPKRTMPASRDAINLRIKSPCPEGPKMWGSATDARPLAQLDPKHDLCLSHEP